MPGGVTKRHHVVPQTYMKKWCYSGDSVFTYDKDKRVSESRNIDSILWEPYFHAIKAGSLYTTKTALNNIFGFLDMYTIKYNGEELITHKRQNECYQYFEEWEILNADGTAVTQKQRNIIKHQLDNSVDNTIEERWSKELENGWPEVSDHLYSKLHAISVKDPDAYLTYDDYEKLIRYFIMFDWRGESGNATLNELMEFFDGLFPLPEDDKKIPYKERVYKSDKTVIDEIKHASMLHFYDQFLDNRDGMKKIYDAFINNLTFCFMLNKNSDYVTSDNPAYEFINENGQKEMYFIATPKVVIALLKKDPEKPGAYIIQKLSPPEVEEINKKTYDHGTMIISKKPINENAYQQNEAKGPVD